MEDTNIEKKHPQNEERTLKWLEREKDNERKRYLL